MACRGSSARRRDSRTSTSLACRMSCKSRANCRFQASKCRPAAVGFDSHQSNVCFQHQQFDWHGLLEFVQQLVSRYGQIVANDNLFMHLTNDYPSSGLYYGPSNFTPNAYLTISPYSTWSGSAWTLNNLTKAAQSSFVIPITPTSSLCRTTFFISAPSRGWSAGFVPLAANLGWETNNPSLAFTNISFADDEPPAGVHAGWRPVIDYAQFAGPNSSRNLNAEFQTNFPKHAV